MAVPFRGVSQVDLDELPRAGPGDEPHWPPSPVLDQALAAKVAEAHEDATAKGSAEVGWKPRFPPFVKKQAGAPDIISSDQKMAACAYDLRVRSVMGSTRGAIRLVNFLTPGEAAALARTDGPQALTPLSELLPDLAQDESQGPRLLLRRVEKGDLVQRGIGASPVLAPPQLAPGGDLSATGQQLLAKTPPEFRRCGEKVRTVGIPTWEGNLWPIAFIAELGKFALKRQEASVGTAEIYSDARVGREVFKDWAMRVQPQRTRWAAVIQGARLRAAAGCFHHLVLGADGYLRDPSGHGMDTSSRGSSLTGAFDAATIPNGVADAAPAETPGAARPVEPEVISYAENQPSRQRKRIRGKSSVSGPGGQASEDSGASSAHLAQQDGLAGEQLPPGWVRVGACGRRRIS